MTFASHILLAQQGIRPLRQAHDPNLNGGSRLNRGGDRAANSALHTITLCRMRWDLRTRAYVTRRTAQGLSKKEIIRCLKRYIARDVHTALLAP